MQARAAPGYRDVAEQPLLDVQHLVENMLERGRVYKDGVAEAFTELTELLHDTNNLRIYRLAGQPDTASILSQEEKEVAARIERLRWYGLPS